MLQYILWAVSFVSLWLTLVWLNFLYIKPKVGAMKCPLVSFCVPAYNESSTVVKTLKSIVGLDYPNKEIIVVDDGSKDDTRAVVSDFAKEHPLVLISKENGGKASAVNTGLDAATGSLFTVVDADSRLDPGSLSYMVGHFDDPKCGAAISHIRVDAPKNFLERLQRFEYVMSNMIRKVMHNFGTLCITPGVLSVYRTHVLRELGGFVRDKGNLTEDFEIALRLKEAGYDIHMEPRATTYTKVPSTLKGLWRQRIRWSRGFVYNHLSYKHLFFKHGFFGKFQLPVNVLGVFVLLVSVLLVTFDFFHNSIIFISRSLTIPDYFLTRITSFPTFKEFLLARDIQVSLPIIVAFALSIYLIAFAVRLFDENWRKMISTMVAYTILVPYFSTANWLASIYQEIFRKKRQW